MAREMTAAEAAALIRPTDSIGVPLGTGQPASLLHALGVGGRARALAEIADPEFRDQLRAAAEPLR